MYGRIDVSKVAGEADRGVDEKVPHNSQNPQKSPDG
jgi:hypothetical protein